MLLVGFGVFISYNIRVIKKMEIIGYLGVAFIAVLLVIGIWKDFIKKR